MLGVGQVSDFLFHGSMEGLLIGDGDNHSIVEMNLVDV